MIVDNGKYFLYRHIRLDKNEVFYIGIGSKRLKRGGYHLVQYERAYLISRLNQEEYHKP